VGFLSPVAGTGAGDGEHSAAAGAASLWRVFGDGGGEPSAAAAAAEVLDAAVRVAEAEARIAQVDREVAAVILEQRR
jgi:hypothetical protein